MPKCVACDCDLNQSGELMRGYCDNCQTQIRTVFDKDAYALGQYQKTSDGGFANSLEWTNTTEGEFSSERIYIEEDI